MAFLPRLVERNTISADMTPPPRKRILNGLLFAQREAMMTSRKLVQSVALSIGMLFAGASVVAYAGDYCPPDTTAKGNNGWGQEKRGGSDGTNNGSFSGATADTKSASTER